MVLSNDEFLQRFAIMGDSYGKSWKLEQQLETIFESGNINAE